VVAEPGVVPADRVQGTRLPREVTGGLVAKVGAPGVVERPRVPALQPAQPAQVVPGDAPSSYLWLWLLPGPQSAQGTDWTLIGSNVDNIVTEESATAMSVNVGHKHKYHTTDLVHDVIHRRSTGTHTVTSWHHHTRTWRTITNACSPLHAVRAGLWAWSTE
jgi:hypothetical protein